MKVTPARFYEANSYGFEKLNIYGNKNEEDSNNQQADKLVNVYLEGHVNKVDIIHELAFVWGCMSGLIASV